MTGFQVTVFDVTGVSRYNAQGEAVCVVASVENALDSVLTDSVSTPPEVRLAAPIGLWPESLSNSI